MNRLQPAPIYRPRQRPGTAHGSRCCRPRTAAVTLFGCLAVAATALATQPPWPSAALLDTATLEDSGSHVIAMLPGIAEPVRQANLSVPVRGVLMDVLVHEGQTVAARQIVAVMDNRVSAAEVSLATAVDARQAAIREAQCQLQLAENLLARLLEVKQQDAVSELEIDQARSRREQAKASLEQTHERAREAKIQLELARARLDSFNIRAPFAGRVLRIERQPGETVTETDTILILANLKVLRAELYVPTRWYGRLTLRHNYQLATAAPVSHPVTAQLAAHDPVIDAGTQTFRCVFEIDNSAEELPAGFAVQLIRPDVAPTGQLKSPEEFLPHP
jgi:RND family efflux transporter MFP subunit